MCIRDRIIVEGAVEHTYILDAVAVNDLQSVAYAFDGQCAHRFFSSAYAKGASIEATACGLQLDKRFAPIKETAFFRRYEIREFQYTCYAVVSVLPVGVEITESGNGIPLFLFVPACEPLREHFFSFSSEYTADIRVLM